MTFVRWTPAEGRVSHALSLNDIGTYCSTFQSILTSDLQVLVRVSISTLLACLFGPKQPPRDKGIIQGVLHFLPRFSWPEVIHGGTKDTFMVSLLYSSIRDGTFSVDSNYLHRLYPAYGYCKIVSFTGPGTSIRYTSRFISFASSA